MNTPSFDGLPGAELVLKGLADAREGSTTIESLLVAAAAPRLRALGVLSDGDSPDVSDSELRLYAALGASGIADPYSRYNALRRELVSFVHALEHATERARRVSALAEDLRDDLERP